MADSHVYFVMFIGIAAAVYILGLVIEWRRRR